MLPLCVVSCAQPRSAPSGWPASRTAAVSLTAVAGAACGMDVVGHKYETFVQQELQKRAAASRKEGMQVGMAEAAVHAQERAGGRGRDVGWCQISCQLGLERLLPVINVRYGASAKIKHG